MSVEEIFKKVDEEKFVTILEGMVLNFFIAVQNERFYESEGIVDHTVVNFVTTPGIRESR